MGLFLLCLLALMPLAGAPRSPFTPYQTRALFLFHFATFATWPEQSFENEGSSLVVGIVGKDDFGDDIGIIRNELIRKHKVEIKLFARGEEIEGCHLLFICDSERSRVAQVLSGLEGKPIVTVAEQSGFLEQGGMINLIMNTEAKKLEFEVNLVAVRKAELKISSQLLRLAKSVKKDE